MDVQVTDEGERDYDFPECLFRIYVGWRNLIIILIANAIINYFSVFRYSTFQKTMSKQFSLGLSMLLVIS